MNIKVTVVVYTAYMFNDLLLYFKSKQRHIEMCTAYLLETYSNFMHTGHTFTWQKAGLFTYLTKLLVA